MDIYVPVVHQLSDVPLLPVTSTQPLGPTTLCAAPLQGEEHPEAHPSLREALPLGGSGLPLHALRRIRLRRQHHDVRSECGCSDPILQRKTVCSERNII